MAGSALLVIDLQTGMFDGAHLPPIFAAEALLVQAAALIARARAASVPVVYVRHDGGPEDPMLGASTPGWPIHPAIAPHPGEAVVDKRHPDAFHDTTLVPELTRLGARRLIVTGAQTEYCIDTTCRRAFSLGFETVLAADAHSTWDAGGLTAQQIIRHHNRVLGGSFVTLKAADEIEIG